MAKLGINTGSSANDGTGDSLRVAGGKINTNFDEIYSNFGDGTNLSAGIVTNITAGNFISISTSFGDVTITGLANTENITAESLVVTGISTVGVITGATSLGVGSIYAIDLTASGAVIANNFVGDGSALTGLASTDTVSTSSLVVSGISTLGIVTDVTSIKVTDLYVSNLVGFAPYAEVAGLATFATNAGIATYADSAGIATFAPNAGLSTHATTAGVSSYHSSWVVGEDPTNNSHYRFTGPGVQSTDDDPQLYLVRGQVYRFTNQMGRHPLQIQTTVNGSVGTPYTDGITNSATVNGDMIWDIQMDAPNQLYYQCQTHGSMGGAIEILSNDTDFAGYADFAGISTYADSAGIATYASSSGVSTNSTFATYSNLAGIATYADSAGIATYASSAGIATYAPNAGVSTYSDTSGISTFSGYATLAGVSTYSDTSGIATYASSAGIATYASSAGIATYADSAGIATYAPNAGLSTNATYAGYATTAGIATVSVNSQGLTGTPDITVDSLTANELVVSGVTTLGNVNGTYFGNGSNLTGVVIDQTTQTFSQLIITGVSTLGVVTGIQAISGDQYYGTKFTGAFSGDGSDLTGVVASGSIGLSLDNSFVGAAYTEINMVYDGSLDASFVAVGDTGTFTITGLANTAQTQSDSLVVTGVSTLGVITGATSIQVSEIYGDNFSGNSGSADQVKTQSQSLDVDYNVTFVEGNNGSPTNENVFTKANLTYNTFSNILSAPNVSASSSVTAATFYGDGSGITNITSVGTGVSVQDGGSLVGTASTINFGNNLSVTPVSAGIITVTASGGSGITTAIISADTLYVAGIATIANSAFHIGQQDDAIQASSSMILGGSDGNQGINFTGTNISDANSTFFKNIRVNKVGSGFKYDLEFHSNGYASGDIGDFIFYKRGTSSQRTERMRLTGEDGNLNVVGIVTGASFSGDGSELVDGRWTLGADGTNNYTFTGIGFTQTTNDPDFYLARGRVYEFVNGMGAHGFQIQDTPNGTIGNPYNNGVTNNGSNNGTIKIEVPFNAPDTLYYQCVSHTGMGGTIFIYPALR